MNKIILSMLIFSATPIVFADQQNVSGNNNSYYNNPYGDGIWSGNSNLLPTPTPQKIQSMSDYSAISGDNRESYNNISNNY